MKVFISRLIITTNIILAVGRLLNPTIITITLIFSQGDSISIPPRATDPNNDQSFVP
jgi:hypothetical protein